MKELIALMDQVQTSGPNLAKGDFLAKEVRSGAQSSEESAVALAGTRTPVLRVARKYAQKRGKRTGGACSKYPDIYFCTFFLSYPKYYQ